MSIKQIAAESNSAAISNVANAASHFKCDYSIDFCPKFLYDISWGATC